MYIYYPKIRKFTKLFINNYYKELLCNDNEYYYDIIFEGLIKIKQRCLIRNNEKNVKSLQNISGIPMLFYEEKALNYENKIVTIVFVGIDKNRCLFMNIIDDYAYLENLSNEINYIEDMINFSIDYFIKNGVKKIYLNDNSEFICNGYPISLAKWYILSYGNTYYGLKFGFVPKNNENHINKIRDKIMDKKLSDLLINIEFNNYDSNMLLQDFFREIIKDEKYCHILHEIINKTFELFNLKFNEGIMYEKVL